MRSLLFADMTYGQGRSLTPDSYEKQCRNLLGDSMPILAAVAFLKHNARMNQVRIGEPKAKSRVPAMAIAEIVTKVQYLHSLKQRSKPQEKAEDIL